MNLKSNPEFLEAMPKQLREQWHDLLVSGRYEQGQGALYNFGKYCCLGVFMHGVDHIPSSMFEGWHMPSDVNYWHTPTNEQHTLACYFGDQDPLIALNEQNTTVGASEANDGYQKTFAEIARLIYPEGYQ